jgi:hypothetical protein
MDRFAEEGFILGRSPGDGRSVLLIVNAETEQAVRLGLAADPWIWSGLLHVAEVGPCQILLGGRAPTDPRPQLRMPRTRQRKGVSPWTSKR